MSAADTKAFFHAITIAPHAKAIWYGLERGDWVGTAPWYRLTAVVDPPRLVMHHIVRRRARGFYLRALSCPAGDPSQTTLHRLYGEHTRREMWFEVLEDAKDAAEAPSSVEHDGWRWAPSHPGGLEMPVDDGKWFPAGNMPDEVDEAYERDVIHRGGHALVTVLRRDSLWAIVDRGSAKQRIGGAYVTRAEAEAAAGAYIRNLQ